MRGWAGRAMSAARTISAGCATDSGRAGCRPPRGSCRCRSRRCARRPSHFVSKLFPRGTKLLRTGLLRAMVIGAFVRGLSMRDVGSLCERAGLGKLSRSAVSRICSELRERFEQFRRRDFYEIHLAALFLDAVFLSVRRDGRKEGVLVAWGALSGRLYRGGEVSRRRPGRARGASALPGPASPAVAIDEPARAIARRGQTPHEGHRPVPRADELPHARVGGP